MKEILREYAFGAGEALQAYQRGFRRAHPDVELIDSVLIAEMTINGETKPIRYTDIESARELMNKDIVTRQRATEMCNKYTQ